MLLCCQPVDNTNTQNWFQIFFFISSVCYTVVDHFTNLEFSISNQFHSKWTEYDTTKSHMHWQISSHAIALLLSKIFGSNSNNKSNLRHGWWNDLFTLDMAVCPWIACPLSQEYNSPRFRGCDECASGIAILLNIDKGVPVAHRPTKKYAMYKHGTYTACQR